MKPDTVLVRIIYDHQVFSLQDVGGATRYHYELARYLASVPDVQVELLLGLYRSAYPFHQLAAVRGQRAPLPPGMLRYALNEVIGTAASLVSGKYDVYHPTYFRFMPVIRARRIVTTHHDCVYEQFPHLFRDASTVILAKGNLYARADRIICISEASRRGLLEYYSVDAGKTCVVHHGLTALPRSPQAAQDLRSRLRRPFMLYVGIRNCHKNFSALLHAYHDARLSEQYDLLALGGGPLSATETAAIASFGMGNSVVAIPSVSDEFLSEAYATAELFVYPSLSEGFGIPPLEAMAAGCPVAASEVAAILEVCGDAPFYFDPGDVSSMVHALLAGVGERDARQRAIARGREVAARYSWERCGADTLAVYRECL